MAAECVKGAYAGDALALVGAEQGWELEASAGLGFGFDGFPPNGEFAVFAGFEVFAGEEGEEHVAGPVGPRFFGGSVAAPPVEVVGLGGV